MRKLWGGAFGEGSDSLVDRFGQSIESDLRFWREDVLGSIAHAQMLGQTGILEPTEAEAIVAGLQAILDEGPDSLPLDVEDIHTAVEVRLGDKIGPVAGKLHTARSRNDQVATDTRLHLRHRIAELGPAIKSLQSAFYETAQAHRATVMPGYTHQQPAQPITLALHQLAHFWALQRAGRRLQHLQEFVNLSPLGSAALAGTGFPIDRAMTADALGFAAPIPNALDATSDRSFVLDALHWAASAMIDLSRVAQELVLWSGAEFGFVRLADAVTTGSSIMPQKRNPDMAELIRGRAARAIGNWTAFAATMKALPLGYNRDTQDDKPGLFESLDLVRDSLALTEIMIRGAEWQAKRMREAAARGFSTATDVADYLASTGMPFREAHEIVGSIVKRCRSGDFEAPVLAELLHERLTKAEIDEAMRRLSVERSVRERNSLGGPGEKAIRDQLRLARRLLQRPGFASLT